MTLSPHDSTGGRCEQTTVFYAGMLLTRLEGDVPAAEVWLPMGEEPTFADDETLIAALHEAMRWTRAHVDDKPS
ncbi:hypothetical protein [Amycolatopsis plumensis]|uniref:hypothetical protein n=1 Tax=Amycolatopsis plumensis TaxID=236508 RepID=UPI0036090962